MFDHSKKSVFEAGDPEKSEEFKEGGNMFDHSKESLFEACGVPEKSKEFKEEMVSMIELLHGFEKLSEVVEFIVSNIDEPTVRAFLIMLIQKAGAQEGTDE